MNTLVNNATALANHFKCLVFLVHHSGHTEQDRGRGWSGLKPALDAEFKSEKAGEQDGVRRARFTCMKLKDGDDKQTFIVALTPVVLGENKHGKVITTLVVKEVMICEQVPVGNTNPNLVILRAVKENPAITQKELAATCHVGDQSSVSRIKLIEELKYIRKEGKVYEVLKAGEEALEVPF